MDISNSVKALILLGLDGKRVLAKYFDDKIKGKQFEKQLYHKTKSQKSREDILMLEGLVVLHRYVNDLHIYVAGSRSENPLLLDKLLSCLTEVVSSLLSRSEQQSAIENMDQLILAMDEISDSGIILETDPNLVIERVCLKQERYPSPRYGFRWVG